MLRFTVRTLLCLAACTLGTLAHPVAAQTASYPNHTVRIVVPFAVGGSTDIVARSVAALLGKELNQSFIVENRAGASGNIGAETVAKAAPDGYTLLFTTTNLTMNPALPGKLPYDAVKDFVPVTMVAFAPMILVKSSQVKAKTVPELIEAIRASPGQYNFSSSGKGGAPHLAGELFRLTENLNMVHVPYNGAAPALNDVAAGTVQLSFTTYISAQSYLQGDRVIPMAVASKNRLAALPNVPTFDELGVKGIEIGTMFGLLAPAGTPPAVVRRLYDVLAKGAQTPEFQKQIRDQGGELVLDNPADYATYIRTDVAKWKELISKIGSIE